MRRKFWVVDDDQRAAASAEQRVAELEQTVAELERHQELATEAEDRVRREMADILHSRVQSRLLAATLRLRRVEHMLTEDPASAARFLEEVRRELDTIREDDVREVSHLLHPAVVSVGLLPALRRLAKDLQGAASVTLHASREAAALDDLGDNKIPEPVRLALYRTVEEATTNALKHGDATEITVRVSVTEHGELLVRAADNGCGFVPASAELGLGLRSIETRLAQHGGRFEIQSAPGTGTTVAATIPVDTMVPEEFRTPANGGDPGRNLVAGS